MLILDDKITIYMSSCPFRHEAVNEHNTNHAKKLLHAAPGETWSSVSFAIYT